ncbi:MAG: major Facilitator Superfamily protein [Firmicutes bacterium]|nr:major Facilitator Superfamily protein [Bacillota bacterium]
MNTKAYGKDFSIILSAQIISILGSAVLRFALDLYVLDTTGRADIFALVIALSTIPGIVFSPIGGGIADRFPRKNLLMLLDICSSGIVTILVVLLTLHLASVPVISLLLSLLSLVSAIYQPAVQASIPALVQEEHLTSANGIVSAIGALSGLLGPVLGGVLYGFVKLDTLLAASSVAFLLAALLETRLHIPFTLKPRDNGLLPAIIDDIGQGFHYIRLKNPKIYKTILIAAALNLLMSPFFIIGLPYILRITLHSNETLYGIGMGVGELSNIFGAVSAGSLSKKLHFSTLYRQLLLIAVLFLPMAFTLSPLALRLGYWPTFVLFMLSGACVIFWMTVISVFVISTVQKETPNDLLGKVMAIIMAVAQCAAPLGQMLYGVVFAQCANMVYLPVLAACAFTIGIAYMAKALLCNPLTQ